MDQQYIEITTKVGKLKGLVKKSSEISETIYYSFLGIPYAKPPIGHLRFKAPEPFGPWEGVRDATKNGNDGIQQHVFFHNMIGDEDCLYLNVYTPVRSGGVGAKKAVMVWFHSGGFCKGSGSSTSYGPELLIGEDIVLVTVNYRLGVLGFLSLESEKIPGNAGLRDQVLALIWVRDNISSFGGDPGNVTIFGHSAGGASVNYHLISPLSKGLFHKAILQSGTALCQWAFQDKAREKALLLASSLGCASKDDEEVAQFLRSLPASEITKQNHMSFLSEREKVQRIYITFTPCVEAAGKDAFLPDYPRRLMEQGEFSKVPVIIGVTDKEGLLLVAMKQLSCDRVNADPSVMVPIDLNITPGSEEEKALGREILRFYTDTDTLSWTSDIVQGYTDFISDTAFVLGYENARQCFLKHMTCPVYSYLYTYISKHTITETLRPVLKYPEDSVEFIGTGASHADEVAHLFKSKTISVLPLSADDQLLRKKLAKGWTTFAKLGNPNCPELGVTWQPDNIETPNFIDLGQTFKVTNGTVVPERLQFWKKIYDKYSYLY